MQPIIFDSAQAAVERIADELNTYSRQARPVHISLSGGSTPKLLFKTLAAEPFASEVRWENLHFWWGDERMVPPQDPESNYGEVQKLLFDHITIPAQNIHRIRGEQPVQAELNRFTQELRATVPDLAFDWIILGMGTDGHTASLFPNQTDFDDLHPALIAKHPQSGQIRISKSATLIAKAKRVTYLVTGAGKAEILRRISTTPAEQLPYPAARIQSANGITEWYLDKDAAKFL
ncbi:MULTISPECIES: 6-phosphogluconolactonase [Pasteurellaceae]|uniref:6-phosphogluconolactonase n=1 Tax=Pasteurellaceae TaxID=712 RepID=UPI003567BAA6